MTISRSKIAFKAPFNDLSFGQVAYGLTKAMYRAGLNISIFPVGDVVNLSAYDTASEDFLKWLQDCIANRYKGIDKSSTTLQLWHLRGSDARPTDKSALLTFHEILGSTDTEKAICGLHDKVLFSSAFSRNHFNTSGVKNVGSFSLGFDDELKKTGKTYLKDVVHFGLIGKWESRKNTELIISTWADLFGNKKDYRLTCLVENPFFNQQTMAALMARALKGKQYFNITFLPRLKTNSEVNDLYNAIDIDLSGLSSAEGWNLPAFNATCFGKWSVVANHTSHKEWATAENSILVEPDGLKECYDGAFFKKGDEFNQGFIYQLSEETIRAALTKSTVFWQKPNPDGLLLGQKFTYDNALKGILDAIN